MPHEVVVAMERASKSYVSIDQLNLSVGRFVADLVGVPAVHVSCGAASGMQLAAAACLTGADRERVEALPQVAVGRPREFVVPLVDVHAYIYQLIAAVGGVVVGVGSMEAGVTVDQVRAAVSGQTVGILYYLGPQPREQLQPMAAVAREAGVPLIVDAAAQLPPRSNLHDLVTGGADLAVFSGGKGLRGPQASGLMLGDPHLVEAAHLNSAPASAVGRGMKVGKEELLGVAAAVEVFMTGSDEADLAEWQARCELVRDAIVSCEGIRASIVHDGALTYPAFTPRVRIDFDDAARIPVVSRALREGEPAIQLGARAGLLYFDPMTLLPGETEIVAVRLREAL